jgi:hypothetical protein
LSTSDRTEFDEWVASMVGQLGEFTVLVVLADIGERSVTPLVLDLLPYHRRRGGLGRHNRDVCGLRPELERCRILSHQGQ